MNRGFLLRHVAAASAVATLAAFAAPPVSADGNSGLHLHKTVDPAQLTINPNIGVSLSVDKTSAIPGDTLTYTAAVTNPTATFTMGGDINAQAVASADATVAYYWDEFEVCAINCGNGMGNPNWKAVATFEAATPGYVPMTPPSLHTGMSFAAQPVNRSGVVYPASGDPVLGTDISPNATAAWTYTSRITLSPTQSAMLSDPTQALAVRNVLHMEVTVRNSTAAQPYTDPELFTNPFTSAPNPAAIANVNVAFTLPDGTTTSVPATASLTPGASATSTATYKVPVPGARGAGETEAAYVKRLHLLDGSALTASAVASGAGFSGTVYATSSPVTTNEFVPIVIIAKSGPTTVNAGDTETNPLALQDVGGAAAAAIALTDTVPSGGTGTISGAPASIAAGATASATASFAVPVSQASGDLTDTAAVTWQDANGNPYGPLTSSFTTQVHNVLFGATLTLAPVTAGPNVPGTSQQLTATLKDAHGNPIAGQVVHFTVTGANAASGDATTDATGVASFTYTGANSGNDSAQATVSAPGITITSNTSAISWLKILQPVALTAVQGNFFRNDTNSCTFGPTGAPVFGQAFPDIMFNPDPSVVPHDISRIGNSTRPFFDVTTDVNGNYNGQIMAQGNGVQAGNDPLQNFYAVFTGSFIVNQPGDLTFRILHNDGYIIGVGGGATRVNGDLEGSVPATTQFNSYTVVGAWNTSSTGSSSSGPVTVHFPAPGSYPFELDYTECESGPLFLDLLTEAFVPQSSQLGVYVGYADALRQGGSAFPFPWNGSPNVNFFGCTDCRYDAGALRFDNNTQAPITFDSITVDLSAGQHFDIWPHGITLAPGQLLVLTQTTGDNSGNFDNFDTSDFSGTPCNVNNGVIPTINVTIAGVTTTYKDVNQILNTGGFDTACNHNEDLPWRSVNGVASTIQLPVPPSASLNLMPFNIPDATQGQSITVTVSALDGAGNPQVNLPVTLSVIGANTQTQTQSTNTAGLATFSYPGNLAGTDSLQASTFVGGLRVISNQGTVLWTPPGGNTNNPLGATISGVSPADGAVVTRPVAIDAAITAPLGQTVTSWRVFYQAQDPGPAVTIASGSGTPPSPLATFDPTLLPNDAYAITVEATSSNGAVQRVATTVVVMGNLKLGRYTATYQDLSVPVNGFQMEVLRTYDSIDKSSGDFGVGWRVDISNFRVAPNRTLGAGGWTQYNKSCVLGLCTTGFKNAAPRYVTVTFPDQHTEIFDFTPVGGTNVFWTCTPAFTARGALGTTSTLEPLDDTSCSYTADGNLYGSNGGVYSPHRFRLTTHSGTVFILDQTVGLVSETDRNGNSLTLDSAGLHASNGESILYTRDSSGRITRVSGPSGETVTYTYSAANDLETSVDNNHNSTTYTYDGNHDLLTASGAQPVQKLQYDSAGRLIAISDAFGNTVQIQSDVAGQQQTLLDPAGRMTTVLTYDDLGDVVRTDKTAGGTTVTTRATFDAAGHATSQTDGMQKTQFMQYDSSGNMTVFIDPNGTHFHFAYNAQGQLVSWSDDAGTVLGSYQYDAAGNLTQVDDPSCPGCQYTYDSAGRVSTQVQAVGGGTSYFYDAFGHANRVVDARGDAFVSSFDASGHLLSRSDPLGGTVRFTYDGNGNVLTQEDALHQTTTVTYTPDGSIKTVTDPLLKTITNTYDAAGRLSSITDRNGLVINIGYDANGHITGEAPVGGDARTRTYDGFGRLTQIANGSAVITLSYDADGRIVSQTTGGTASDPLPTTTFTYTYDANGNRLTSTGPDGQIINTYDEMSRLSTLTDPNHGGFQFGYDAAQRLSSLVRPNGVRDDLTYDNAGDLLNPKTSLNGTTLSTISYAYGPGRLTSSMTDSSGTTTYTYDQLLRLTGASSTRGQETYQYDAGSNRTSAQTSRGTFNYTYDSASHMLSDGTFDYAYDGEGNLTTKTDHVSGATTRFFYDAQHRLTKVQLPNGNVTTYQYDPIGHRVAIDANGAITRYAYDGDALRLEYDGGNNLQASYVSALGLDSVLEMRRGSTSYYYVKDALGSVRALVDSNGAVVQTYAYDSFGNQTTSGSIANPFTYTGREFDPNTGLYYNRARYYDPATGRFLSEDPAGSLNRYVYTANDPVNLADPTGASPATEAAIRFIFISALAGAIGNAVTTALFEWQDGCFDWRDVLMAAFAGALGGAVTAGLLVASPAGWMGADAAGGAVSGGVQDLGDQMIHHPGHIDGGEAIGYTLAGAGLGVIGGVFGGDWQGVHYNNGWRDAGGRFASPPSLEDGIINNLLMGFLGGMLQGQRNHTVCPS